MGEKWWTEDYGCETLKRDIDDLEFSPPFDMSYDTCWKNGISTNNEEPKEEEWPGNGSGSGNFFIKSLKRGDRIGNWARAMVGVSCV